MIAKDIKNRVLISDLAIAMDQNEDDSKITNVGMIIDPNSRMVNNNIIQSWIVCFASAKNKTLDWPLVFSIPT